MKTKHFAIVVALLLVCMGAKAQTKSNNLYVGFAPLGSISESISYKDEKYKYKYKSYWNVNLSYEKLFKGSSTMTELFYSKAKFNEYDLKGESQWFNPNQAEDIYTISFTQYYGTTINKNKRVQFPLYIGFAADYAKGGPLHNLLIGGAAKARVKFYITNSIGIYVGATGRLGWGSKKASDSNSSRSSSKNSYSISSKVWYVDAGITFSI